MGISALVLKQLDENARAIATKQCRSYLSDAQRCLRDTGDPIAPLELLRAMWNSGQAPRAEQKDALDDAGRWLEDRLKRDPEMSPQHLELELGWLLRLITIHEMPPSRGDRSGGHQRREPGFGAHIDALRRRREHAIQRTAARKEPDRPNAREQATPPGPVRPERLPDNFEACFASWQDAVKAFKTARERSKAQKAPKDRLLPVRPIQAELQPLATDIVCSLLNTQGMDELQTRAIEGGGELPAFWISVADLIAHDGKRLVSRISFPRTPAI